MQKKGSDRFFPTTVPNTSQYSISKNRSDPFVTDDLLDGLSDRHGDAVDVAGMSDYDPGMAVESLSN